VTDRSAEADTRTLADALLLALFGSLVVVETDAASVIVEPETAVAFTFTTNVKLAVAFAARVAMVQVKVTLLQVHPAGPDSETKVVLAGSAFV